ncbi:hypothetical protein ACB092_05G007200 [Castanea dentata]
MNIASPSLENAGLFTLACGCLKFWANKIVEVAKKIKKLEQDDPKRIIHSLKVGLALTLVSLFYYIQPLYDRFGEKNAMWAIFTVIIVFEFSVGETLGKGLNRMLATLSAGALGVGRPYMVLGFFLFIIAATVTFVRFFPTMKARYDYGLMIFIMTFSLVSVSSYQEDKEVIIIDSFIATVTCVCIHPFYFVLNLFVIQQLNTLYLGFGDNYFMISKDGQLVDDKPFLQGYKSIFTSKNNEETMWHYRFGFFHPWKQYIKVGTLTRQCAYKIETLNNHLNFEIQTLNEFGRNIQEPCTKICSESGKALRELASAVKKMNQPSPTSVTANTENSKTAIENRKFIINTHHAIWKMLISKRSYHLQKLLLTLIDVVPCIIADAVHELASLAHFKTPASRVSP